MPAIEPWRKTLYAVAAAQFIALGGGNLVFPFMPFYVKELGIHDKSQIALWSGLLGTATGSMLFVFSPIWGNIADRFGRKPILLRAYVGAMITMTLQGLVHSVWQLLLLRGLQGVFVGTIPAATALVASKSPRDRVAYSLGVLQMALFSSQFVGPLVGGALAASIGIRETFLFTGAFYLVSFLLVYALVDEEFERPPESERLGFVSSLRVVADRRPLMVLIGIVFFLNVGPPFVRPVIPILVDSFDSRWSAETLSGVAFAALAATSAVAALAASRLSQLAGYRNALALVTLAAGLAYLPVAMANNVPSLIIFIGIVGLFSGAMIPTANTLIDAWTPPGRQASAFGLVGSAMALAFAVGPLSGGAVASLLSVHASFIVIGLLMIAVAGAIFLFVRAPDETAIETFEPVEASGGSGE
jgi:DHA1 family multidrug resistance protein-like MFS transporter